MEKIINKAGLIEIILEAEETVTLCDPNGLLSRLSKRKPASSDWRFVVGVEMNKLVLHPDHQKLIEKEEANNKTEEDFKKLLKEKETVCPKNC